jgi:hypothetical protein
MTDKLTLKKMEAFLLIALSLMNHMYAYHILHEQII